MGYGADQMGYGADQTGMPPFFVVTHTPPHVVRLERELGMRVTFVGIWSPRSTGRSAPDPW